MNASSVTKHLKRFLAGIWSNYLDYYVRSEQAGELVFPTVDLRKDQPELTTKVFYELLRLKNEEVIYSFDLVVCGKLVKSPPPLPRQNA